MLVQWAILIQVRRHLQAFISRTVPSSQANMGMSIYSSSLGRKWSLSRMLVQSIVVLRQKVIIGKFKATKRKSELKFKELTKELKESCCTLSVLQVSSAPTVADTPKTTPAPAVSGAGTEMTLYTAGTLMGGRASRREWIIKRFGIWIAVTFRALLPILQSRAHL